MNLGLVLPTNYQESLARGRLDFIGGTFTAFMMRAEFGFLRDRMITKLSFEAKVDFATSGAGFEITGVSEDGKSATLSHVAADETSAFYFNLAGFVVGNHVRTTNASNAGVYVVRSVAPRTLELDWVSGDTFTAVTGRMEEVYCVDEAATDADYTRYVGVPITATVVGRLPTFGVLDLTATGPFGTNLATSGGLIICADAAPYAIAAYAKLTRWAIESC